MPIVAVLATPTEGGMHFVLETVPSDLDDHNKEPLDIVARSWPSQEPQ
jgi:hypothetical protein